MTFEDKLTQAGFKNRPAFARAFKIYATTVNRWGEKPPYWATWACDKIIAQRNEITVSLEDAAGIIEILEK